MQDLNVPFIKSELACRISHGDNQIEYNIDEKIL